MSTKSTIRELPFRFIIVILFPFPLPPPLAAPPPPGRPFPYPRHPLYLSFPSAHRLFYYSLVFRAVVLPSRLHPLHFPPSSRPRYVALYVLRFPLPSFSFLRPPLLLGLPFPHYLRLLPMLSLSADARGGSKANSVFVLMSMSPPSGPVPYSYSSGLGFSVWLFRYVLP